MKSIVEIFENIIKECDSIDIAEAEFKRMIADDTELRSAYTMWCDENGSTFRQGFLDYCEEYINSRNSVWDTLTDYDE